LILFSLLLLPRDDIDAAYRLMPLLLPQTDDADEPAPPPLMPPLR